DPSSSGGGQGNPLSAGRKSGSRFQRSSSGGRRPVYQFGGRTRCAHGQAAVVPPVHSERHARFGSEPNQPVVYDEGRRQITRPDGDQRKRRSAARDGP